MLGKLGRPSSWKPGEPHHLPTYPPTYLPTHPFLGVRPPKYGRPAQIWVPPRWWYGRVRWLLGPRYPHVVKNAWSVFLDPSRSWDTSDMPVKHQKWGVKSRETVEKPGRNGRKNLPSGPKQHFCLPTYLMMRAAHAILNYTGDKSKFGGNLFWSTSSGPDPVPSQ